MRFGVQVLLKQAARLVNKTSASHSVAELRAAILAMLTGSHEPPLTPEEIAALESALLDLPEPSTGFGM